MRSSISSIAALYDKYNIYLKSSFLYVFSSFFSAGIAIAINPYLADNLSLNDYAVMGYYQSFSLMILPILNFSLISYYLRNYYRIPEERRPLIKDTILIALALFGALALAISLAGLYLYCWLSNVSFPFHPFALLSFAPLYLGNFATMYLVQCRLERDAAGFSTVTIWSALLGVLLALLLVVFFKYGAIGRLSATLLASLATALYCLKKLTPKLRFDWIVIREALKFGWPLSISAILWFFLSGVDRVMLERLNDKESLGYYSIALQIANYLAIFYTALSQTFEPDIYRAVAEDDRRKLLKIASAIVALNALPNLVFIAFSTAIVGFLTYYRYTGAAEFAQILALKNIMVGCYYAASTILVGYGFTKSELAIRIIGALFCIVMFKTLIGYYAFWGAAWGQVIAFVVLTTICLAFLRFWLGRMPSARGSAHSSVC